MAESAVRRHELSVNALGEYLQPGARRRPYTAAAALPVADNSPSRRAKEEEHAALKREKEAADRDRARRSAVRRRSASGVFADGDANGAVSLRGYVVSITAGGRCGGWCCTSTLALVYFAFAEWMADTALLHLLVVYLPLLLVHSLSLVHAVVTSSTAFTEGRRISADLSATSGNISTVGSSITEWKTRDTLNSNYADNYLVAGYYFFGGLPELANFYYSGFSGAWPSMRYVYSATVPAPFVHAYAEVHSGGQRNKIGFARNLLAEWDIDVSSPKELIEGRSRVAETFRALISELKRLQNDTTARTAPSTRLPVRLGESQWRQRVRDRSASDARRLRLRRVAASVAHTLLQVLTFLPMGSSEYVATVAISGTNAVMPTVGFFLGRMLTLGTVFLAYYGCFTGADVIVPKKPLQDHFAQTLLLLVLIEFVLLKLVVLPLLLRRPKGEIYLKVIHLVYFQSLFWMLMPFLPWASALMCLCFLGDLSLAPQQHRKTIAALLYPAVAAAIAAVAALALSSGEDGDEAAGPEHKAAALPRRCSTTRLPPALPLDEEEASLLLRGWIPGYDGARAQTLTRANAWVTAVDTDRGRLKVSTAQHGPFLLFRVEAEAEDSEAAALVSLFREVDLLPQWNRGVRSAELEELRRPSEM
ncbi:hypothetical protein EMIHUDRAFT_227915, partial [Emiliania huxleyi CCMP1516]|uniref:START domain-containing protein n=2 Tax=Emiliania huxleyi TaxID=2903 RepID=A0A0D3KGN3_EMIH1